MIKIISNSENETRALGRRLGEGLTCGVVIGLDGTLGTGKTRLVQGLGEGLGVDPGSVVSPTYTIAIPYAARIPMLHMDAYRIKDPIELDELGLDEWVENGGLLVIEWAGRVRDWLPDFDIEIEIRHVGEQQREVLIQASPEYLDFCLSLRVELLD